jgi:hypothetical protein
MFHEKFNPMADLHFYGCFIGICSMVWASFDVRIQSKNDPRTGVVTPRSSCPCWSRSLKKKPSEWRST